ncbi:MAG: serine/threonine-protein kinase, partial [Anaerolineales bacterium]
MPPESIGRYQVKAELLGDDWSQSYLAVESESERQVVVKVVKERLLYTLNDQQKFAEEMQRLKDFDHPVLVPLLDFGVHERSPFFVVPNLVGGSLADRMDSGPLSPDQIIEIFTPLSQALDEAADRGFFHHNLRPDNILFDEQNQPRLVELGIMGVVASLSAARIPIANPEYASPEQIHHQGLDARSQVYSLAALAYHALTGQPLFQGATDRITLFKHTSERPKKPSELRSELPQSVDLVFLKALSKDPKERYPDVSAFIEVLSIAFDDILPPDGLDEFLIPEVESPEPEAARQIAKVKSEAKPLPAGSRQNVIVFALLGIAGLLVVCGIAVFLLSAVGGLNDQEDSQASETAAAVTAMAEVRTTATAESAVSAASVASLWPVVITDTFTVNEHNWFEGQESDQYADLSWEIDGAYIWQATAKRGFVWRVWPRSDYV